MGMLLNVTWGVGLSKPRMVHELFSGVQELRRYQKLPAGVHQGPSPGGHDSVSFRPGSFADSLVSGITSPGAVASLSPIPVVLAPSTDARTWGGPDGARGRVSWDKLWRTGYGEVTAVGHPCRAVGGP